MGTGSAESNPLVVMEIREGKEEGNGREGKTGRWRRGGRVNVLTPGSHRSYTVEVRHGTTPHGKSGCSRTSRHGLRPRRLGRDGVETTLPDTREENT